MKTRKTIVLATVVLVAAIGVIFVTRPISDPRPHSPVTLEFFHAGEIRNALFTYSNDHNGGFPKELSELPSSSIPPEARQFHEANREARETHDEAEAARRMQVMVIPARRLKKQRERS